MDLSKLPVDGGVRQRGDQVTRLETFVDAAFAFAVTEPGKEAPGDRACKRPLPHIRETGMQGPGPDKVDTAAYKARITGRTNNNRAHHGACKAVRTVRVQKDNGNAEERGVEGEPQEGGEDLETGRIEGAEEAAQKRKALAG